jgi:hypothetical protein
VENVTVSSPAPGTPADALFPYCTVPVPENGYRYPERTEELPLPVTVFPPYALWIERPQRKEKTPLSGRFRIIDPAGEAMPEEYIESSAFPEVNPVVPTKRRELSCSAVLLAGEKELPVSLKREGDSFLVKTEEPVPDAEPVLLKILMDDGECKTACFLPVRTELRPGIGGTGKERR